MPETGTVCGLPPPLSATEIEALRLPVAVGVNVTEMEQLAPGPREVPQVVLLEKSVEFVPVTVIDVTESVFFALLFFIVIDCAGLLVPTD